MAQEPFLLNPKNRDFVQGRGPKAGSFGFGCTTAFCVVFLLFGIPFFGFAAREWYVWARLHHEGAKIQATVVRATHSSDSDGDSYHLEYRFELRGPDGVEVYRQEHQSSQREYNRIKVGGPIGVIYARSNPAISRSVDAPWQGIWPLLGITAFLAVWSAFPFVLLTATMRARRRERLRLGHGQVLPGQIVHVRQITDSDGDESLEIDYVFTMPDGRRHQTTAAAIRNDLRGKALPEVGAPVRILFASAENFELL